MKVSVVIPIYNVEKYIEACVNSVRNQTLTDIEIICIHDKGSDNSFELVKQMAKEDSRICLYENDKNMGLAATRNKGMDIATGQYIYFLDSDDMIVSDALEKLYERAEKDMLEVQVFGASFIYENDELKEKFHTNPRIFKQNYENIITGQELFIEWMKVWDWMPSQPRFFYKKAFLTENHIRFEEGMLHEDEVFTFEVLNYAKRIKVTQEEFFIRRFRTASIMTGNPTIKNVEGCVKIIARALASVDGVKLSKDWNKAVKFYVYKIYKDAVRKYKIAKEKLEENNLPTVISEEISNDPAMLTIFHMIEAFGIWEEV